MNKIQSVIIFLESNNIENTTNFYNKVFDFRTNNLISEHSIIRLENSVCTIIIQKKDNPNKTIFGLDIKDTTSLLQKIQEFGNIKYNEFNPFDSAHQEFAIYDIDGNTITLTNYNYK